MNLLASVVVTAFDREASLKRLLIGLNHQSVAPENYEVIVADDSGDNRLGEKVITGIESRYRLSTVRTGLPYEVNGVSVARNLGIKKAMGDIIISIDDDCFPSFFFVEEHITAHRKPYPVVVLGHRSGDAAKLKEDRPISVTEKKASHELMADRAGLLTYSSFMTGNISLAKHMALETGLFNENFAQPGEHGYEDIELGYRLWRKGIPTIFSRNAMIYRPTTEEEKNEKRRVSKAVEKASHRLINLHPLIPLVQQLLSSAQNGSNDQALAYGAHVLSKDPEHWPVLLLQGDILSRLGRFEDAQTHLVQALRLYDHNPAIHLKLAQNMYRQKRYEEALSHISKSLELNPLQSTALYLLALLKPVIPQNGAHAFIGKYDINLELGGGDNPTKSRAEGHDDYINLDMLNLPTVDVVTNFYQKLPIPSDTASHIFSREMIEHLPYKKLPGFIKECFRVLKPGGKMYLCCPDFESILRLYAKQCGCFDGQKADPDCQKCKGTAIYPHHYWRSNLLGDQNDYDDDGFNDTHKNQITYGMLSELLEETGFVGIQRDPENIYYEVEKREIKLSVKCRKPIQTLS